MVRNTLLKLLRNKNDYEKECYINGYFNNGMHNSKTDYCYGGFNQ